MSSLTHRISEGYKRWRHTHGFGVHSPFAYRIVQNVLNLPKGYAYYGEEELRMELSDGHTVGSVKDARRLLRLIAFLDIRSAYIPPSSVPIFRNALLMARSDLRIITMASEAVAAELVSTTGDFLPLDTLRTIITGNCFKAMILYDYPEGWPAALFEILGEGVMFMGKSNALIIRHTGMQKVCYTVNI